MNLPPPVVCHVARVNKLFRYVPITVVVSVAKPGLPTQVVNGVDLWRVGPEELVLDAGLHGAIGPEILEEVDSPGQPVPPHKHLVEKTLVTAIVGDDFFA